MVTLFNQTLKLVVGLTSPQASRTVASDAPMTDTDLKALQAFCQMWSYMWGYGQHNQITAKLNGYEETNHVHRSE
jgi:hypothetical protein